MVEMVTATLNGEFTLTLPKHRADRPEWFDDGGWEKARMQALVECVRSQDNPVVYYIGAEMGELGAILAMQGAKLYLFEPNPLAWPSIKAIWDANQLDMPYTFPGFASNESADLDIPVAKVWPDSATAVINEAHGFKELHLEARNYPQIRVDDVALSPRYEPPTIITCDVEGSEFHVMRGAEQTIDRFKPVLFPSIHPEFMALHWGEHSRDLRNWICDKGYGETWLAHDHEMHMMYEPKTLVEQVQWGI